MSADTIVASYSNPQSLNRYSYVKNNPILYNDPTGHMEQVNDGGGSCPGDPRCPSFKEPERFRQNRKQFVKKVANFFNPAPFFHDASQAYQDGVWSIAPFFNGVPQVSPRVIEKGEIVSDIANRIIGGLNHVWESVNDPTIITNTNPNTPVPTMTIPPIPTATAEPTPTAAPHMTSTSTLTPSNTPTVSLTPSASITLTQSITTTSTFITPTLQTPSITFTPYLTPIFYVP